MVSLQVVCLGCSQRRFSALRHVHDGRVECLLRPLRFDRRQVFFHEGLVASHVYVVRAGLVRTYRTLPDGRPQGVRVMRAGSVAGLDALATGEHPTTGETLVPSVLCALRLDDLKHLSGRDPTIGADLTALLCDEVAALEVRLHDLSLRRAHRKLAACLADLAPTAEPLPEGLSQRDLADLLGMSPETVCRVFADFRRKRYLRIEGRRIVVESPEALRALADES